MEAQERPERLEVAGSLSVPNSQAEGGLWQQRPWGKEHRELRGEG